MYDTQMASTIVKSIRVSPELWARVEHFAKLDGTSPNACVVRYLSETLLDDWVSPPVKRSIPDAN